VWVALAVIEEATEAQLHCADIKTPAGLCQSTVGAV